MICVICVIDNNHEQLLPHFLNHYRQLGVDRFVFGIRRGSQNPAWPYISDLSSPDIEPREFHPDPNSINGDVDSVFINEVKDQLRSWYVPADLDEFHSIAGDIHFSEAQKLCEEKGSDFVMSELVDRISPDGKITPQISPGLSIYDQFPKKTSVTGDIMGGCVSKVCLANHKVNVGPGHHMVSNGHDLSQSPLRGETMHFKWFGDVLKREKAKYEIRSGLNSPYRREQAALFKYLIGNDWKLG